MCYNKSMKRIDVLKGIEQILVQKAYEAGHISHRADGDWQKQADGSWKPYTGQSAPHRWFSIHVQKSAVRDMQSAPITKNMGF